MLTASLDTSSSSIAPSVLVELANSDRTNNHAGRLTSNSILTAVAQAKANDMAKKGYFAHVSPEGESPWYWFKQEGYSFTSAGENLAIDFTDSSAVEEAWMNSPTHRANLLNGNFTEVGIATAVGTYQGRKTIFVAEEFGRPAATASVPAPVVMHPAVQTSRTVTAAPVPKPTVSHTVSVAPRRKPIEQVLGSATTSLPETAPPVANRLETLPAVTSKPAAWWSPVRTLLVSMLIRAFSLV